MRKMILKRAIQHSLAVVGPPGAKRIPTMFGQLLLVAKFEPGPFDVKGLMVHE